MGYPHIRGTVVAAEWQPSFIHLSSFFLPARLLLLASFGTDRPDTVGCFTGVGMCGVCLGAPWVFFVGLTVGLRVLWLIPAVSGRTPLRCPVDTAEGAALRSCGIVPERGTLVGVLADAGAGRTVFPATVERAGPVFLLYRLSKAEVAVCCWAAEAVCCCAPACT